MLRPHGHRRSRSTVGVLAVLLAGGAAHATDGLEPIGVSLPANARGGADVAVGDTTLAQIENPATLWLQRPGTRFDVTGQLAFPLAPWRGPFETEDSHRHLIGLGSAAMSFPLDDDWTMGLALHSKAGLGTRYSMRHLLIPWMDRDVGSDMKCVGVQVNLARKITDNLALGFGGRIETATTRFSTVLGPADLEFGRGYATGAGFQAGLLYRPREDLQLGLSYRSPTWFSDLEGGEGRAALFGALPIPLGDIGIRQLRLPQRVAAGVAWDATDRLKLVGEVRWLNYAHSTFDVAPIETEGWLDLRYDLPLGYRDQLAFMAGAEYALSKSWIVAGGYHYATAPVRPEHLLPMGSTISQHHVTLGLRYEQPRWWAGVGYVLGLPTSLHGDGRSAIPLGIDYGFSDIEQTQHILAVGFGLRFLPVE